MNQPRIPDDFVGGFWWTLDSGFLGSVAAFLLVVVALGLIVGFSIKRWGPKP